MTGQPYDLDDEMLDRIVGGGGDASAKLKDAEDKKAGKSRFGLDDASAELTGALGDFFAGEKALVKGGAALGDATMGKGVLGMLSSGLAEDLAKTSAKMKVAGLSDRQVGTAILESFGQIIGQELTGKLATATSAKTRTGAATIMDALEQMAPKGDALAALEKLRGKMGDAQLAPHGDAKGEKYEEEPRFPRSPADLQVIGKDEAAKGHSAASASAATAIVEALSSNHAFTDMIAQSVKTGDFKALAASIGVFDLAAITASVVMAAPPTTGSATEIGATLGVGRVKS